MGCRGALSASIIWGWLLGSAWLAPAVAQIRALPPTVVAAEQPAVGDLVPLPCRQPCVEMDIGTPLMDAGSMDAGSMDAGPPPFYGDYWSWQFLPHGLIYRSYLAAGKESRFASHWIRERDLGWLWDIALGGRVGMLRCGTRDGDWPEGWQLDVEGAVFPRLAMERNRDLVSADFRVGLPLTVRRGRWEGKFSYYHFSSHLGDEFIETFAARRINYVRDAFVLGVAFRPNTDVRLYTEAGWAFYTRGGSRPWEFQFGIDYSPAEPLGVFPAPFFAVNGRIRQEVDFGGNFTVQTGFQWRGQSGHLLRFGMHYFNGMSDQYQFFTRHEEQIGLAMWYDY